MWVEVADDSGLAGRSPHGERGLKYGRQQWFRLGSRVALLMESVD